MLRKGKLMLLAASAALLISGCSLPGLGGSSETTVKVATLSTSESSIIGHMIRLMIEENTELNVEMIENLGSSLVQHQALTDEQVDITATRYTGTDISGTLGMDPVTNPDKAMDIVQKEFDKRFDQVWYNSYGFANTYAFTVTEELAKQENLETVSDVKNIASDLRLGVDNAWLNRKGDGYDGFVETYGFEFGEAFPMQLGLVYEAVRNGEMDVVLAYSTDGRLKALDLKTLEDDKKFFPPYECSPVVRADVIEKHPEVDDILKTLTGKIDNDMMTELNFEADVNKKEPAIVAQEFLEKNDYFR